MALVPSHESLSGELDARDVQGVLRGERLAKERLYSRHVDRLLGRTTRLLGQRAEAEDVTHDAFVLAFADLAKLREPTRFGSWLLQIAVRLVHRRFRRRKLLRRLGFQQDAEDAVLTALARDGDPEVAHLLARVDEVLSKLTPELRIAWMLRLVEGCSLAEVAEQCACSLATVKRRIALAQTRVEEVAFVAFPEDQL